MAALGLSLVAVRGGYSLVGVHGLLTALASHAQALGHMGISSCGTRA